MKEAVRRIINEWDPAGLMPFQVPEDEYDSEVNDILKILENRAITRQELSKEICSVFEYYFNGTIKIDEIEIQNIAKKLKTLQQQNN